jgi:non-specific serine/threonine protein kinase
MVGEGSADAAGVLAAFGPGSRLAGYVLEEQVGAGGMAVIFRAVDQRLGRRVALKILAPALAADQAFRQRFIRESRAAAAVDDPYIIPVYEAGEAAGVLFIAMRLVPGHDVRTLLHQQGPLPPGRAAAIISQVASALDAAHAAGLVHRDVKPANMLIDMRSGRADHVYLADFGISKRAISSVALTGTGQVLGTLDYIAPEQIEGRAVDGRTDQYALACAAFELLAGEPPFRRDQGMAIIWAHLSAPPPPVASLRPGLPGAVDTVFATALAKAPEDRFASCQEFAQALAAALGLERPATSPPAKDEAVGEIGPPAERQVVRGTFRDGSAATRKLGEDLPPAREARQNNFGAELSSFVGRRDDLAALRKILAQSRLVSLVGAGGVGKTRLAVRLATEVLGSFDGGAWLVDLASLSDAFLIAAAALSALGGPGQAGRPAIDTLIDFLMRRSTLVVLDNCEHLLDGCAELVGRLLSACPDVKVLATTREAMNIPGEVLWKVRPLSIPDEDCALDGLRSSEAVELFTDRTRAVEPDFEITAQNAAVVTQICRRLDGMPLAIELAASRVRSIAVHELSSRLDDRFHLLTGGARTTLARQRTLEATVTWSYDLLSEEERVLFDRLSVFSGGCTTDSARRVCSGGAVSEERVLELVGLLADRSMLVADKHGQRMTRYRMLETLRQFGQERLAARGESEPSASATWSGRSTSPRVVHPRQDRADRSPR